MDVGRVVEVRVHGVSGTPAPDLLDRVDVVRVSGNATAGFYRPRYEAEATDSFPTGAREPATRGPVLEGYVWGGLTSGAPSRAFWLLLLPLTLINVAPRLRPDDGSDARRRAVWVLCRALALTMTLVFVAAFAGVGIDLIGWQCGPAAGRCVAAAPGWLFDRVIERSTAHRMELGALVPLLGIAVLWYVSGRTSKRYEAIDADVVPAEGDDAEGAVAEGAEAEGADAERDAADEVPLTSRWMWRNTVPVKRQRALHVQAAFGALLAIGSTPLHYWWVPGVTVGVGVVAYAAVLLLLPAVTSHRTVRWWTKASGTVWATLGAGYAVTGWRLGWCADYLPENDPACRPDAPRLPGVHGRFDCSPTGAPGAGLPAYSSVLVWLLIVQFALVAVLGAVVLTSARAARRVGPHDGGGCAAVRTRPTPGMWGLGTVALAMIAVFLASVFTAGAYLYSAAYLHTGTVLPSLGEMKTLSVHFLVPEAVYDGGLAYSVAVILAVVLIVPFAGWLALALWRAGRQPRPIVPGAFDKDYPEAPQGDRRTTILRAMLAGRLVDLAGPVLGTLVGFGSLITSWFVLALLLEHLAGVDRLARWLVDPDGHAAQTVGVGHPAFLSRIGLQATGGYLVVFTLVGLVSLGAAAFRARATRRSVGILWDLASFWPRLCHPLAAPCYAERTVPDLVKRVHTHITDGHGVVLAPHSQGTVISAAAVQQLSSATPIDGEKATHWVAMLTYGCVLRRLYGRFFPVYLGPHTMGGVADELTDGEADARRARWWNLWRYTDYLGGPILSGPEPAVHEAWDPSDLEPTGCPRDLHLVDPDYAMAHGDTVYPPTLRHSDFWRVPQFQAAVHGLARALPRR